MKQTTNAIYSMAIAVLYSVLKFAWNLYLESVKEFTAFSDIYTKEYGENMLKAIESAQAMPDNTQRHGNTQVAGNRLDKAAGNGLLYWKTLRRFVMRAYQGADLEAALKQAGASHYEAAAKLNYGEISLLLSAGQTFLAEEADILHSKGMPAAFTAEYAETKGAFDREQASYGIAKGTATDGTGDKIIINNGLYTTTLMMLGDAQLIFEEKLIVQKQFSVAAILRRITVPGASGLHFKVCDAGTETPLTNALITIGNEPKPYPVSKRGVADIKLKKGSYQVSVLVPGYTSFQGIVTVSGNVMHRVPVLLTKAEAEAIAS